MKVHLFMRKLIVRQSLAVCTWCAMDVKLSDVCKQRELMQTENVLLDRSKCIAGLGVNMDETAILLART